MSLVDLRDDGSTGVKTKLGSEEGRGKRTGGAAGRELVSAWAGLCSLLLL